MMKRSSLCGRAEKARIKMSTGARMVAARRGSNQSATGTSSSDAGTARGNADVKY